MATTTTIVEPPKLASDSPLTTAHDVRQACRSGSHDTVTAGLAPGLLQANLIVLPSRYANDFRLLCARNPVPCPLLAESAVPGCFDRLKSCIPHIKDDAWVGGADDFDIRTDLPRYNIYRNGALTRAGVTDIKAEWNNDHVAFLIGCSFSFETALAAAGLTPAHVLQGRNVPMYRTSTPLCPAGIFKGPTYVVSMRPYAARDVERVRHVTRGFGLTHGEPIDWGWDALARLGIGDVDCPDWGDAALSLEGGGRLLGRSWGSEEEVPVFWGCGVTPQEAVMRAEGLKGTVMAHQPGCMLVLDAGDGDVRVV